MRGWLAGLVLAVVAYLYLNNNKVIYNNTLLSQHLAGKTVLICGASSGIGERLVYKYASAGARLIISARSEVKLVNVKKQAEANGAASVTIIIQDFSDVAALEDYTDKVLAVSSKVDIVVLNHAAIPLGPWTAFKSLQDPQFVERVFRINVLSFVELTRLFLPHLETSKGQLHITSSISGIGPHFEAGLYSATKHSVHGFYRSLQQELTFKLSPVTVTIFTLGLIVTNDMDKLLSMDAAKDNIPQILQGDVDECADVMISAALTRAQNVDYPVIATKLVRLLSTYFPWYNQLYTQSASMGKTYDEYINVHIKMNAMSDKLNYQVGNRGTN